MNQLEDETATAATRPGRAVVAAIVMVVVVVVGYFAFGMPGMDHGTSATDDRTMGSMDHDAMSFMRLDPDAFAVRVAEPSAFVVNVHTPYAGEIHGTDAFVPFDEITDDNRLPTERSAPIVLYCETGEMSEVAANALVNAGYTNVVDLEGGMEAWRASGMTIADRLGASD